MTKAAFLDRDGVINRKAPDGQYVTRWEDFHFLPGVVESIIRLREAGFSVIVVTNQRCVAKGLLSKSELNMLHRRMSDRLAEAGANIDAIYYCPHESEPVCGCRKPAPGMLVEAARSRGLDLTASWMIGDSEIDVQAGKSAGCRTAWLCTEYPVAPQASNGEAVRTKADVLAPSLLEAVPQILGFARL